MTTPAYSLDKAIAAELRALRAKRRLSQRELAELAGVHKNTINRIENGHRGGQIEHLAVLCNVLGVKLSDFMLAVELEVEAMEKRAGVHADPAGGRHELPQG